ncbi:hypothetical protein [Actinomadura sp. K4S16]|uniref:hypothetical protein n=1 Tax=Actinomadura sp. K4S16 TaxID=1316147 RepID=UPI0011ED44EE|nr:hypothetical protein [Actinomadura sp. K4S16]
MHVLDDLAEFSDRAQGLLSRAGRRAPSDPARTPTDFLNVRDRAGRVVPAPAELVVRREGFEARYGGLRYEVRRSALIGRERFDVSRRWDFSLDEEIWADERGWFFSWTGERVSSPVRFLIHTDGRVGVSDGGPFIEVADSVPHLIEGHAVMDMVSSWDPWPGSLETWVPAQLGAAMAEHVDGLAPVAEASGRYDRWHLSEGVAVRIFWSWTSQGPRTRGVQMWTCGEEGRRQLESAAGKR